MAKPYNNNEEIGGISSGNTHNASCDSCRSAKIYSDRYKCLQCIDYDLCGHCFEERRETRPHSSGHAMVHFKIPNELFGQVYKAIWLSKNREVACKVIRVTAHRRHLEDSFRKELNAYAELSGAYILKTFGYGERLIANGIKECYLITELMHRGSLSNVIHNGIEKISLRRKLTMACHVVSGMRKLHAHTMIHRDIRPDNILVSSNYTAKIGDMGIAHVFNPEEKHTLIGCLPFMPPEFHRGDGQYDQSLDVFTFGLTLNELFTEKLHRFIQATKRIQITEQSSIFLDLITRCIHHEPTQRPTAVELEDVLNMYRRAAEKYIKEKHPNYTSQTLATKDAIFVKFYDEYHKLQKEEPKPVYSLPPRPRFNSDLIRQYFDDMMKQFNSIRHRIGFRRSKHQQPAPQGVQGMKYFDDACNDDHDQVIKLEPIKIDKRPARCPSPPSNFPRAQEESQQQFLNAVKHPRSRTPVPLCPHFDNQMHQQHIFHRAGAFRPINANNDIHQRVIEFHLNAGFDQSPRQFHRMMHQFQ
ncbi:unnamed protein product [Rotaria sp. Silwood1]|nr:unnamed protein product [Rotaria sp. Silwood1]CAF0909650.1 unnamed protein product [Rotaria sp. Silwood1]CAF3392599.1 unnamed protein product [Rotaria sp. Silwood1]CAF4658092.1 unnamed protein product [Rotaria sp. Silwood1]